MNKHLILIIVLAGLLAVSTSWAVVVTGLYNQNSGYIEVGKQVIGSAKNIDAQLRKCGNSVACDSVKRDMGDKVIDTMIKLSQQRDH